jgi:RNA-directed DNA polymerase
VRAIFGFRVYGYFGISGNGRRLGKLHFRVRRLWYAWLSRRSWKSFLTWEKYERVLWRFPLPLPRIVRRYIVV